MSFPAKRNLSAGTMSVVVVGLFLDLLLRLLLFFCSHVSVCVCVCAYAGAMSALHSGWGCEPVVTSEYRRFFTHGQPASDNSVGQARAATNSTKPPTVGSPGITVIVQNGQVSTTPSSLPPPVEATDVVVIVKNNGGSTERADAIPAAIAPAGPRKAETGLRGRNSSRARAAASAPAPGTELPQ
jgi:hypothetical protein